MKRILINATHNEEIRVALCRGNHLYDFDLENRTREQKKANIYKGHITRVEPSLEAVFVEYGSAKQGFLPLREIAPQYLNGNPQSDNIKQLIKEGDELIIQIEKEERGNKGAAISTYLSLAGRYLVLMPNNPKGGGISRQISGKVREELRSVLANLDVPKGMSIIVRTAGIGKNFEDLQNDLSHLLGIWDTVVQRNQQSPSPTLLYQEAGVVTRAMRDYLRDDISEVWIDSENAYNEAASFIESVMPSQLTKLRKYTDYEPLFVRFGVERQIESAYQREVRLPSGGSIVIDQTEALVSIDINSAKSTKGSDVSETAYHTNLEAAEEIARQLRLRDMGGLIVIDFIDMNDPAHQKEVEKRLIDATRHDRARVQFAEISKFGLMQMSRQRLRPSLEESTGYLCPRCHGNGMIRDLRSLALSIMRQIEQLALKQRTGEIQAEVPTEIAAFLLNEKRESLVYLEQDSGTRITILPHAHLESPNFELHFNADGFAPASYSRIVDAEELQTVGRGYEIDWQTNPTTTISPKSRANHWQSTQQVSDPQKAKTQKVEQSAKDETKPLAWLSNLFAPKPEACLADSISTQEAALAIETIVNTGATSLGASGDVGHILTKPVKPAKRTPQKTDNRTPAHTKEGKSVQNKPTSDKPKAQEPTAQNNTHPKREAGSRREPREPIQRGTPQVLAPKTDDKPIKPATSQKPQETKTATDTPKPQQTKTDDITVRIEKIGSPTAKPAVVHLSLDEDIKDKAESIALADQQTASNADVVQQTDTATRPPKAEPKKPAQATTQQIHTAENAPTKLTTPPTQKGLAINDPRVVIKAQGSNTKTAITGSAGEFIRRTLPDADKRLAKEGFIACFNEAVALAKADDSSLFDFKNYGYAPLSDAYLTGFEQSIRASNHFGIAQGKTAASPKTDTPRATNDPRHAKTDTVKQVSDKQSVSSEQPVSNKTDEPSPQTNSASLDFSVENAKAALSYFSEQLASILDDNTPKSKSDTADVDTKDVLQAVDEPAKTTPAKYKNMIENIAEQLLPQTGILKLATPKPTKKMAMTTKKPTKVAIKKPKVDTKPKVEIRKRSKNAQSDTPPTDTADDSE